jgi:hypothetical protein
MRIRTAALAAVVTAATAAGLAAAPAFAATPASVTAVTHVVNRPDGGNGGTWAYDTFTRTLVVTVAASQAGAPEGDTAYTATVTDKGTFTAVEGSLTPSQAVAGLKVAHAVKGTIAGSISYTVTAPSTDAIASLATATENDDYAAPAAAGTTANWPERVFASATGVTVTEGSAWSWTYATACEKWTDSAANGDGNTAADGNITGRVCAVPVLFGGKAVYWLPTREQVTYSQTLPSWVMFTIVGPGFNGQHGWVDGAKGLNTGYYEGLEAHHGYTVLYVPVTGQGSTRQVPGTHAGYVYFVSDVLTAS